MSAVYCQFEATTMPNPQSTVFNVQPPPNPASVGNRRAEKSGAHSDVSERVQELFATVLDTNRHLDAATNGPAIVRYCTCLARCERVYQWLREQSDETFSDVERGTTHAVLERLRRWEVQCDNAERALAIAPLTRAKLGLTQALAVDAATLLSAARLEEDPTLRRQMLEAGGLLDPPVGVGGIAVHDRDGARTPDRSHNEKSESGVGGV